MTNQKPFSINETTNKKGSSKSGMPINDEGICAACEYSFKKNKNIDWQLREEKLLKMLEKIRRMMEGMTALFLEVEVKTVELKHIY